MNWGQKQFRRMAEQDTEGEYMHHVYLDPVWPERDSVRPHRIDIETLRLEKAVENLSRQDGFRRSHHAKWDWILVMEDLGSSGLQAGLGP